MPGFLGGDFEMASPGPISVPKEPFLLWKLDVTKWGVTARATFLTISL